MLEILLNLDPDIGYRQSGFSKTWSKKSLKFIPSRRNDTVAFNLSLVLLPVKIDFIPKKQSRKRDTLVAHSIGYIKIIFALLIKVITLYI